jgi:hypothetical protein
VKKIAGKYPRPPRPDPERQNKQDEATTVVELIKDIMDDPVAFDDLLDAADMVYEDVPGAKGKFNAACRRAGANNAQTKYLWNLLAARAIVTAKSNLPMDAPFCWG